MPVSGFRLLDGIALAAFFACWIGYAYYARRLARRRPNLVSTVRAFRQRWAERMVERELHISDASILTNLLRGTLFFASTTILILGGLVALLGTTPTAMEVVSRLPFSGRFENWFWELKTLILICLFIYAFFKFTWSAWQYNVLAIVLGTAPKPSDDEAARGQFVQTAAHLAAQAGESYNEGIRTYYFSIAFMGWFIHPLLLIIAASGVAIVLHRREFSSPLLAILQAGVPTARTAPRAEAVKPQPTSAQSGSKLW